MVSITLNQFEIGEQSSPDLHELKQEVGSLRAIIAELLMTNQNLRWELLGHRSGPVHDPGSLATPEGTPLRRKSLIAGMP